jgi:predicted ATPase
MFEPLRDNADLAIRFAQDIGVAISTFLAYVLCALGEVDRMRMVLDQLAARSKQTSQIGTTVYALGTPVIIALMRWNPSEAATYIEMMVDRARTHQLPMHAAWGAFYGARSRWLLGGANAGLEQMRNSIPVCRARGIGIFMPLFATHLAEAEAQAGDIEAALATIDGALAETERHGRRWFEAETYRVRAEERQTRPCERGTSRASSSYCHCHRTAAKSAEFRAARGIFVGEALSEHEPRRRRPRRPRARARRLFSDSRASRN